MTEQEIAAIRISVGEGAITTFFIVIAGILGRSWFKRQLSNDQAEDKQQKLIDRLDDDGDKWRKLYEECHYTSVLLQSQVAMMRAMLLSKGCTEAELAAIGVVVPDLVKKGA